MIPASELAPLLEGWDPWDAIGVLGGLPVLTVLLDDVCAARSVARLANPIPVVLIGVHQAGSELLATGIDIQLTEIPGAPRPWVTCNNVADEAARLEECVRANPTAAASLVQLLRHSDPSGTTTSLLAAESWTYGSLQAGAEFDRWLRSRPAMIPAPPTGDEVITTSENGCLTVTLNRPSRRNAYNAAMRDGLLRAVVPAVRQRQTTIRLRGNGTNFCSGGDLSEFGTTRDGGLAHLIRTTASPALWLDRAADRTEVSLHGACIGAGIELAAFASRITADIGAHFRLPEVEMGLIPGAGGTVSITRRIGAERMAWMAIGGNPVDASSALSWGLVDSLVPG